MDGSQNVEEMPPDNPEQFTPPTAPFKRPILVGKIGKLPKKITSIPIRDSSVGEAGAILVGGTVPVDSSFEEESSSEGNSTVDDTGLRQPQIHNNDNSTGLSYTEPAWSGLPQKSLSRYNFEILKSGSIIGNIDLMEKPFWVFGRLGNCDICLQHPTISRYHAVIQFRSESTETDGIGFYLYDLGSTHGTFLNKRRLRPRTYVRIQVGHMLKLGCSTRSYILNGPIEDTEQESELSVTELKQKRKEEVQKREQDALQAQLDQRRKEEELKKRVEDRGVDWGMGEDAEEESDLSENPFAQTNNEQLYLDDPKKALRGFFEREGLDLEYDCSEQGIGQFLCKVELPLDDDKGRPILAEVFHKGKKKEAVVQCALEACRILDRHGVLRKATHESHKRKPKDWEAQDYYDSDDDTFLDRTGTIERKRQIRMQSKVPKKAETYESLTKKEQEISAAIRQLELDIVEADRKLNCQNSTSPSDIDSLDSYMLELNQSRPDRTAINKLKSDQVKLKQEHANIIKLVNIARPASLPPLVIPDYRSLPGTSNSGSASQTKLLPLFGKRKKVKIQLPEKPVGFMGDVEVDEDGEDMDENDTNSVEDDTSGKELSSEVTETSERVAVPESEENPPGSPLSSISSVTSEEEKDEEREESSGPGNVREKTERLTLRKFEKLLQKQRLPPLEGKHMEKLSKILHNLKKLAADGDRMQVDWKILEAKKRKVMKLISDVNNSEYDEKLEFKISSELSRILNELNAMTDQKFRVINKVKKMGNELKNISEEVNTGAKWGSANTSEMVQGEQNEEDSDDDTDENEPSSSTSSADDRRKRRKNQRRMQQRQDKAELDRQKGYNEDAQKDDYNMWVPPSDQSGDGRTHLNEKLGY